MELQDVIIIGGGPAGLNAAVVLGRCLRKVLLFDTAQYRNRWSHGMHNYLTRDHMPPSEFIKISYEEIRKYGVQYSSKKIVHARRNPEEVFIVRDEDGTIYHSKKLLVATGLVDKVPQIEGFLEMYGKSVHHCPYCDGWEARGKKLGVYARDKDGSELALALKGWSNEVTLYTDGKDKLKPEQKVSLSANNIPVVKLSVARLQGVDGQLQKIVFKNGEAHDCDSLFFVNGFEQQCDLAETFGCNVTRKGVLMANRYQQTNITGLYVAGDATRDMHFVVVAAAEGAKAGVMINKELQKEASEKMLANTEIAKQEAFEMT
jgi:thioredoxin reductase